jgi:hypothetical protein
MKNYKLLTSVFAVLLFFVAAQAADFKEPVLITSAGQSSDVLMAKILAGKAKLDYKFNKAAKAAAVDSASSIIIVSGGSVKGMGAAGINKEDEYERVNGLIKKAKELKKPIICMHVGGKSRRGKLSDYFNQLVAENSDMIIVVAEGDHDQFFTKIAAEKSIQIEISEKIVSIQATLKNVYKK